MQKDGIQDLGAFCFLFLVLRPPELLLQVSLGYISCNAEYSRLTLATPLDRVLTC